MSFDHILEKIGPFNLYQWLLYLTFTVSHLAAAANMNFMAFGNLLPLWHCNKTAESNNCSIFESCPKTQLTFLPKSGFYSVVEHFQLLCSLNYASSLIISFQMLGVFFGALAAGPLADNLGRKPVLVMFLLLEVVVGSTSILATNWKAYVAFRFFIGFFTGGHLVTGWTLMVEVFGQKHRFKLRPFGYSNVGTVEFSLLALLLKDWRWLSVVANLQSLIAVPVLIWGFDESPRWLIQQSHHEQAARILRKISRVNRRAHSSSMIYDLMNSAEESKPLLNESPNPLPKNKKYHVWHLFGTKKLAMYSSTMACCWFTASEISYGLNLHITDLSGNPYVVLGLMAFLGWMASLLFYILDSFIPMFGRKLTLTTSLCAILLIFGTTTIWQAINNNAAHTLPITILSIIGASMNEVVWMGCYRYSAELFPTVLRNISGGFCSSMARMGAIVSPYIMASNVVNPTMPYGVFEGCIMVSLLLTLTVLPETKHVNMPETIHQM